jgi:erythromycin esterase-like protein
MPSSVQKQHTQNADSPPALLAAHVTPFESVSNSDVYNNVFDDFGNCRVLLIGDASHGTSEFYAARAELSKYMIEHHGFNIVAIEGDWPDAEAVDRYVRRRLPIEKEIGISAGGKTDDKDKPFLRFPTWMWRNLEVQEFVEWLRCHNAGMDSHDGVGFYGLDLYSLRNSMHAVIEYLDLVDSNMADVARRRYDDLLTWADEPHEYGLKAAATKFDGYEKEVILMLADLLKKRVKYSSVSWDGDEFHGGEQNARVVAGKSSTPKGGI